MNWKEPCPDYTTKLYFVLTENVLNKMMLKTVYNILMPSNIKHKVFMKNKKHLLYPKALKFMLEHNKCPTCLVGQDAKKNEKERR
jgi:hypothetical protein